MDGACLQAALDYARRGWVVVPVEAPCSDPGLRESLMGPLPKRNLVRLSVGQVPGSEDVQRWWQQWPGANVGVVLGAASGLIALVLDGPVGQAVLAGLQVLLPRTVAFRSPQGGWRFLFRPPADGMADLWTEGEELAVRVLGEGNLLLVPPSCDGLEREQTWLDGQKPGEIEVAECPPVVLRMAQASAEASAGCATEPARVLMGTELMAPRWAVPGVVPEGITLLCGRPKSGKSWLALDLAVGVAGDGVGLGGLATAKGDVLYLALEEGRRRLRGRLERLLAARGMDCPARLALATSWKDVGRGGLDGLGAWLTHHREARLIVIETLKGLLGQGRLIGGGVEEELGELARRLKVLAEGHGVGVLALHHTRYAGETMAPVLGNTSLTGPADGVLVLTRRFGSLEGRLQVVGRDFTRSLALAWDRGIGRWQISDEPQRITRGEFKERILALLREEGALRPKEVALRLGMEDPRRWNMVRARLTDLFREGLVTRNGRGRYLLARPEPENGCALCVDDTSSCQSIC